MATEPAKMNGTSFCLVHVIDYSNDSVVSQTLLKKTTGIFTLFGFDAGQQSQRTYGPFRCIGLDS